MSAEELEGVIAWAAYNRLADAVQALIRHMAQSGLGVPEGRELRARLLLSGFDQQALNATTSADLAGMLEGAEGNKETLLRALSPKEYFHLCLRIKKQIMLALIRDQLTELGVAEEDLTQEDAEKLDLSDYWHVLDQYFPSPSTRASVGGAAARFSPGRVGNEEYRQYCEMKSDGERKNFLNIQQESNTKPDALKIAILLENSTPAAFISYIQHFSKTAEEKLVGKPKALEFFGHGEDPALRVAQLRTKLSVISRTDVAGASDKAFSKRVGIQLRPLAGGAAAASSSAAAASAEGREEEDEDDRALLAGAEKAYRGGSAAAAASSSRGHGSGGGAVTKERRALETRSEKLTKAVEARGGDPIHDTHHDDDYLEEEKDKEQEEEGRGGGGARSGKTTKSAAAAAGGGGGGRKSGAGKSRMRYTDQRRQGRSITFQDSQYAGGEEDEEEEEQQPSASKGKGKRLYREEGGGGGAARKKGGGGEEEELEGVDSDSDDDESSGRPQLKAASNKRISGLHRGGVGPAKRAKKEKRTTRHPWTEEEVNYLIEGVVRHGLHGNWAEIRDRYQNHWRKLRTTVDLKDKWRNLEAKRIREGGELRYTRTDIDDRPREERPKGKKK